MSIQAKSQKKSRKWLNLFMPMVDLLGNLAAKTNLSPTFFTFTGLFLGLASCVYLFYAKNLFVFCILILLCSFFDFIDGAVARINKTASKTGSYLDAISDRYFDGIVAISVAAFTGQWFLITLLLVGALNVSYAKARTALEVSVSNLEWPDLMQRAERNTIFFAGLFLSVLYPELIYGHNLFFWTLIILNIAVTFTVLQRINRACRFIRERAKPDNADFL